MLVNVRCEKLESWTTDLVRSMDTEVFPARNELRASVVAAVVTLADRCCAI
jgi:hypothetical protein